MRIKQTLALLAAALAVWLGSAAGTFIGGSSFSGMIGAIAVALSIGFVGDRRCPDLNQSTYAPAVAWGVILGIGLVIFQRH